MSWLQRLAGGHALGVSPLDAAAPCAPLAGDAPGSVPLPLPVSATTAHAGKSAADYINAGWRLQPPPKQAAASLTDCLLYLSKDTRGKTHHRLFLRDDMCANPSGLELISKLRAHHGGPNVTITSTPSWFFVNHKNQSRVRDDHSVVTPSLKYALDVIDAALALGASDIHLFIRTEKGSEGFAVRVRLHGSIRANPLFEGHGSGAMQSMQDAIAALYQNPDICPPAKRDAAPMFNPRSRHYGNLKPGLRQAELRMESYPTVDGFDVALRVLSVNGRIAGQNRLTDLGLSQSQDDALMRCVKLDHGMILVVGATGNGKTTTVATMVKCDPRLGERKWVSLEDPPEIKVEGVSQLDAAPGRRAEFQVAVVRLDPDCIIAGEINNAETAHQAVEYAHTGHLTIATLHGNSVASGLLRLMGDTLRMDPTALAMQGFLRAVMHQQLVPKLCDTCKVPAKTRLDARDRQILTSRFALDIDGFFVRANRNTRTSQCPSCGGTGVVGRTAIGECVIPTKRFLSRLLERDVDGAMATYRMTRQTDYADLDTHGKTSVEHWLSKAANGLVCASELLASEDLELYPLVPISHNTTRTMS